MKKIMVVDDDSDLLLAMKTVLKKAGHEVAVTTTCEEGLAIVSSFRPELIFLDIEIGTDDGRKMCRQIKSFAEHRHIPIVLFSANYDALKTYGDYGADGFMKKPFTPSDILALVAKHTATG